ncbi:MAG: DNA-3-methyladenine glycosylase [Prolixibacteraceae bacterium]|nr:DNA-3-methyladenine glycosylase [Prolixibacteraceae bacterium]
MKRLNTKFFQRDVLEVAPQLIGKTLVRQFAHGQHVRFMITETEAYRGEEDLACHAAKGRTSRTEVMYHRGGKIYVYLIYGQYWLLNFVTGEADFPAAVLIRSLENITGPGRVGRALQLNRTFYGEDLTLSDRIWVEDDGYLPEIETSARIGVDYAGDWASLPWRFSLRK